MRFSIVCACLRTCFPSLKQCHLDNRYDRTGGTRSYVPWLPLHWRSGVLDIVVSISHAWSFSMAEVSYDEAEQMWRQFSGQDGEEAANYC